MRNNPLRHLIAVPVILFLALNPLTMAAIHLAGLTFGRPLSWLIGAVFTLYGMHLIFMRPKQDRPWSGFVAMTAGMSLWIGCNAGNLAIQMIGLTILFFLIRAFVIRRGVDWPRDAGFTAMGVCAAVFLYPIGLTPALAAFLLVQVIHDTKASAAQCPARDPFRENLRTAEKVLEEMGL